jgi:hypothetical protein
MTTGTCPKCGLYGLSKPSWHRIHDGRAYDDLPVCVEYRATEHVVWKCRCGFRAATPTADSMPPTVESMPSIPTYLVRPDGVYHWDGARWLSLAEWALRSDPPVEPQEATE